MSKICDICQKTYSKGNLVPRGIGRRVTRRSTRHQMPNLRTKNLFFSGKRIGVHICASCLKRLKKDGFIKSYSK